MYKVLIIDDDKLVRKGLISIIPWESCNMTVVGDVANGMLGLEFLKENVVDLAVVDISMPVLSGLDFIKESRKCCPDLQFVVVSFHEDFEYVQKALRFGVLDYISKLRLEEENCTDVFRRVGELMRLARENSENEDTETGKAETDNSGELSEESMDRLYTQWINCLWIYDEERFHRQTDELKNLPISLRQMERLLIHISQAIEKEFEVTYEIPYLGKNEEGVTWLYTCYDNLCAYLESLTDFSQIPVCIYHAVRYIRKNLTRKLRAEDVAQQVNMSRSYFSTNFKMVTGYTFNDYVRYERVELAKKLLRERNIGLSELAETVGYEDSKYFSRIFFAQTGVHCSAYAKQFSSY